MEGSFLGPRSSSGPLKPSDCSSLRGKDSTAEFLVMFETSLGITKDLLQRERVQEQLLAESAEMKTNFK